MIPQGDVFIAYVKEASNDNYILGEQIGVLTKTSRPGSYKIIWKYVDSETYNTVGYINTSGNLVIDIVNNGKTEIATYIVE